MLRVHICGIIEHEGRGDSVPLQYRIDVLAALKEAGYSSYRLRRERLLSESTIQQLRDKTPVSWEVIGRVCSLLGCDVGDILTFVKES